MNLGKNIHGTNAQVNIFINKNVNEQICQNTKMSKTKIVQIPNACYVM